MSRTPTDPADESPATPPPVVRFEGVRLGGGAGGVKATFAINPGGLYLLTGPAGAGKTEAFDLIGLNSRRAQGRIDLFGRDVSRLKAREIPPIRRRIGRVFQDLRLDDDLSAFDNVALAVRATGASAEDSRHQIAELLGWLGLTAQMGKRPKRLSPLDQRRLAIARAVINRPTLIIADEPTGELDGKAAAAILGALIDMHQVGATVLVASRRADLLDDAGATVMSLVPPAALDPHEGGAA